MANCDVETTKLQNHILTWKTENWKLSGQTTFSEIPLKDLCQNNIVSNQFIWPRAITFEKLSSYCSLIDGIPPLIYKSSQKTKVYNEVKEIFLSINKTSPSGFLDKTRREGIRCFASKTSSDVDFWSGMKWNQTEGKWYSPFKPFMGFSNIKEKIIGKGYDCGYIFENSFYNAGCKKKYPCGICKVPKDKIIYLKGLCQDAFDVLDRKYYVYGLKNNRPYFK